MFCTAPAGGHRLFPGILGSSQSLFEVKEISRLQSGFAGPTHEMTGCEKSVIISTDLRPETAEHPGSGTRIGGYGKRYLISQTLPGIQRLPI